jgi:hypothetical protein
MEGPMKRIQLRLSVSDMMTIVLLIGLLMGCVTQGNPSPGISAWLIVSFVLTVGWLSSAALGVLYSRGEVRRFWTGFSVFGWCALGLGIFCLEPEHYLSSILAGSLLFAYIGGVAARNIAEPDLP